MGYRLQNDNFNLPEIGTLHNILTIYYKPHKRSMKSQLALKLEIFTTWFLGLLPVSFRESHFVERMGFYVHNDNLHHARIREAIANLSWLQVCNAFILAAILIRIPFYAKYALNTRLDFGRSVSKYADSVCQQILLLASVFAAVVGLFVVDFKDIFWSQLLVHENDTVAWVGVAVGAVALVTLIWVHMSLGSSWSNFVSVQKGHKLRITRAYKYARHPMYLNFLLHPLAVLLISQNWLLALCYMPWVMCMIWRVKREERLMIDLFGQDYVDYMQRVPAFGCFSKLCGGCGGLSPKEVEEVVAARTEKMKKKD